MRIGADKKPLKIIGDFGADIRAFSPLSDSFFSYITVCFIIFKAQNNDALFICLWFAVKIRRVLIVV